MIRKPAVSGVSLVTLASAAFLATLSCRAAAPSGTVPGSIVYSRGDAATGTIWISRGDGTLDIPLTGGARPRVSPDGRWMVFHRGNAGDPARADVWVRNLVTGAETLAFAQGDYVVGYDWESNGSGFYYDYSCGIYRRNGDGSGQTTIVNVNCYDDAPVLNPAGNRIAFHNLQAGGLVLAGTNGTDRAEIPNCVATGSGLTSDHYPAWSPDGSHLGFGNSGGIYKIAVDGTGRTNLLARSAFAIAPSVAGSPITPVWTRDGQWLVAPLTVDGETGLFAVSASGSGDVRRLIATGDGPAIDWVGNVSTNLQTEVSGKAETLVSVEAPQYAPVGRPFDTVITVRNFGPLATASLVVTSSIPAAIIPATAASTAGSATLSGQLLTANVGTLAAGATARITVTGTPTTNALVTLAAGTVQSRPDEAFNNTASAQISLLTGFAGEISQPGERKEYSFTVGGDRPVNYVFDSLRNDNGLRWRLEGPGCDGTAERTFDSSDGDRISESASVLRLVPGNYTITVWHNTGGIADFAFNLLRLADAALVTPGAQANAELLPGNSTRIYQFPASPGDQIRVRLTATNANGLYYRLVDPFGNVIDRGYGQGDPVTLRAAGNHYLMVEGNITREGLPGSFGIATEVLGNSPLITASQTMQLDTRYSLTNAAPFTNAWRFTITNETTLHFTTLRPNGNVRWRLAAPNGVSGTPRFADDDWTFFNAPPGDYEFTAWSTATGDQDYSWNLRNLANAPRLTLNVTNRVTNSPGNDDQFFRLALTAGQTVYFRAIDYSGYTYGPSWKLMDPYNRPARYGNCAEVGNGFSDMAGFTATFTGDHVLGLGSYVYESAEGKPRTFMVLGVTNRSETITLGTTVSNVIEMASQSRTYNFTLNEPHRISLDLQTPENAQWRLVGPGGNIASASFPSDGWQVYSLDAGEYQIVISGRNAETPRFAFRLLDLETAPPITLGNTYTNTLARPTQSAVYSVNLAAGQRFFARGFGQSGYPSYGPYWVLRSPEGRNLFDSGFSDEGVITATETGTHHLLIGGYIYETGDGPSQTRFALLPVGDTTESLTLDSIVNGAIQTPGQVRNYTFSIASPTRITIDPLLTDSVSFRLSGPYGDVVQSALQSDQWWVYDLQPGQYTFSLWIANNSTPSYRFRIATAAAGPLLALDVTNRVDFATTHETRWARFNLTAGQRLIADVVGRTNWNNGRPGWRLHGPNGFVIFDQGANVTAPFVVPVSGTYDLAIGGALYEDDSPATLLFTLRTTTISEAPLTPGGNIAGEISVPGEQDVYKFNVATPTWVHIDNLQYAPFNWRLSGPQGDVASSSFASDQLWVYQLQPGDYTMTLWGNGETVGAYRFRILNLNASPLLATGTETATSLNPPGGTVAYALNLSAGQTLTNRLLSRSNIVSGPSWAVIDPDGDVLVNEHVTTARAYTADHTGRYALLILGWRDETGTNAAVRFIVDSGPINPPAPFEGSPATFGADLTGTLDATSTNAHTFTLTERSFIGIDNLTPDSPHRWTLRNRSRTLVNNDTLSNTDWNGASYLHFWADPGEYQLIVRGEGQYRLRIVRGDNAPLVTADTDVTVINSPGNSSQFRRYRGTAGERVQFIGGGYEGFSTRPGFTLWRPSGTYYDSGWSDRNNSPWTLPETGDYIFLIGAVANDTATSGTNRFRIIKVQQTTNSLALNTVINAQIPGTNGIANFTFSLATPRRLALDTLTNINLYWTLRRADGVLRNREWFPSVDIDSTPSNGDVPLDLPAGDYTLSFDLNGAIAAPSFRFALWDIAAVARTAPFDTLFQGTNQPANRSVFYSFNANAGETFILDGRGVDGYDTLPYADVYFPGRGGLDINYLDRIGGRFTAPRAGTYHLLASGPSHSTSTNGTHNLVLWKMRDTTNSMALNTPVSSQIQIPGMRRSYTFTLNGPTRLLVDYLMPDGGTTYIGLERPAGALLTERGLQNIEWNYPDQMLLAPAGDYQANIRTDGRNTNQFSFRIVNLDTAPLFTPGSEVSRAFNTAYGTEVFRFSAQAGEQFYYDALGASGFSSRPYMRLFADDGRRIFDEWADIDRSVFTAPLTGTYYLVINSFGSQPGIVPSIRFKLLPVVPSTPDPLFETATSPDLVVSVLTATPPSLRSGETVTVNWTVRNSGGARATNAFSDRVTIRNASGALLASRTVGDATAPLAAGATVSRNTSIRLPDGADATGALEIAVTADAGNTVPERNELGTGEANNGRTTSVNATLAPYPDLLVLAPSATPPGAWLPGTDVVFRWTTTNAGALAAPGPWTAQLVVSNATRRVTLVNVLTNFPAGGLPAGGSSNRTVTVKLPDNPNVYGNLVVTLIEDAANELAEYNAANDAERNNSASFTVSSAADLAVAAVIAPAAATPGVPFDVVTVITNRGSITITGTWQNSISSSSDAVIGDDTFLTAESITATLAPGASLRRTNSVTIPQVGDAGALRMVARTDIGNAIPESDEDNNAGISATTTTVPLILTLDTAGNSIHEDSPNPLNASISRNGPRTSALTVNLSSSDTGELQAPATVTIPAGAASASFTLAPQPDSEFDGPQTVTITASAPGFTQDTAVVTVLDDDVASLGLTLSTNRVVEGSNVVATVSRIPATDSPLSVQILSADASQVSAPGIVVIPAGQAQVTFNVLAVQDTLIERTNTYGLSAFAPGFAQATVSLTVLDDDLPNVSLTLASRTVSEGAGPNATSATLTRSPVTPRAVVIALVSGNPDAARVPTTVTIPANATNVTFPVAAVNNSTVDGPRIVSLGGSVLDSIGGVRVADIAPDVLTVTDDDGPTLSLRVADDVVPEGRNPATTATLTRNTPATNALTVALTSSDTAEARVPATVTIPLGTNSVSFAIESVSDGTTDGNKGVVITAASAGFTSGTATVVVSDSDLPDLVVSRLTVPTNGIAGNVVPVSFRVENRGFVAVTNPFVQRIYISEDPIFGGDPIAAQVTWSSPVPPGGFLDQTANIRLPALPGTFWIIVQGDANLQVTELVEGNNTRVAEAPLVSGASYTAVVSASPEVALANTPILLSGRATRAMDGSAAASVPVDIHVAVRGLRRVFRVTTDAAGQFTNTFTPLPDEAGVYSVSAGFPGVAMPPEQDRFTLQGMRIAPIGPVRVVEDSTISGTTRLLNLSDIPLTGLTANVLSNTAGFSVTAQLATNRANGDEEIGLAFTVSAVSTVSPGGTARIRVTSAQGATDDLVIPIDLERLVPRLVSNPDSINATMSLGRQRVVTFTVSNQGGVPTGPLELLLTSVPWLSSVTPVNLPPLPPGSNTVVNLLLTPATNLALNIYNGDIVLRSTNAGVRIPFSFRAVSESRGSLLVTAEDEYTYFAEGAPRPTNAVVTLSDGLTGSVVATEETGEDGEVLFENLREGDYVVNVNAEGHDPFRRSVHITGAPNPAAEAVAAAKKRNLMPKDGGSPGITTVTAFLPRQTVRYTFTVVPTTVEDRYTLTVESVFETQVPIPVITIDPPSLDLSLFEGDEFQVNFTLSNQGLIAAQNVEFNLPSSADIQMTPLIRTIGKMAPRSSLNIPVLIHRGAPTSPDSIHAKTLQRVQSKAKPDPTGSAVTPKVFGGCALSGVVIYSYPCGGTLVGRSTSITIITGYRCGFLDLVSFGGFGGIDIDWGGYTGSGGGSYDFYDGGGLVTTGPIIVFAPDCGTSGGGGGGGGSGGGGSGGGGSGGGGSGGGGSGGGGSGGGGSGGGGSGGGGSGGGGGGGGGSGGAGGGPAPGGSGSGGGAGGGGGGAGGSGGSGSGSGGIGGGNPVNPTGPDLIITDFAAPARGASGSTITLDYRIANIGSSTANAPFQQSAWLVDSTGTNAILIGTDGWSTNLAAGATRQATMAATLPDSEGDYSLWLVTDATNSVVEMVETNNAYLAAGLFRLRSTGTPASEPDLVVTDLSVPLTGTTGRTATVSFTLRNRGAGAALGPFSYRAFASTDINGTNLVTSAEVRFPNDLSAGASSREAINLTLPSTAGQYWVWVVADSLGEVAESVELNNRISTALPVSVSTSGGGSIAKARSSGGKAGIDPGEEGSVCARVRLRLDQRAVLARDAFKARLELANDTDAGLTELEVVLDIRDRDGQPAGGVFGIRPPTLAGIGAVDGSGSIPARGSGSAEWILIPTLNAAPTNGVRTFLVGGTIIYRQDGVRVTVPLTPAPIDVFPQPELVVRYFHERDVFADDPFTRELEPSIPYALAAQILNVGYGAARSLKISSGQPQIIENEKELLIEFQAIGTRVENREFSPSLDVDFGEIPPGTNKLARWLFTSSLQGSFTNFTATFKHEDAIAGAERLSLIRSVEIHELNRIVEAGGTFADGRPDLLVNDVPDVNLLPDTLYLSDNTTRTVSAVTNGVISGTLSDASLRLRLDVAMPRGWSYLRLEQPGGTNYVLRQVLRPDGSDVGVNTNAWTTDRFIRGGSRRPIRIDLLHLLDYDAPAYYTLVYAPAPPAIPDNEPPVSRVAALPAQSSINFPVTWSGTDNSSGIFSYNIYVSTDGGAFRLWLTNTPLTAAIYSGTTGHTYGFLSSAIDRAENTEAVRTVADATTQVLATNRPPQLVAPPAITVQRGGLVSANFLATDPDPDQRVFFTLLSGAPRGLALNAETGAINWQTGEADIPGTYTVQVRATDNGLPSASALASVAVTLIGTNRPPALDPISDLVVSEGTLILQPLTATDPDIPRQQLTLTLVQGPAGSLIDTNGMFTWRPRATDGPGTNRVVIRVTDNGSPALSSESQFTVYVRDTSADLLVGIGSTNLFLGGSSRLPLSINAGPDVTNITFRLPLPAGRLGSLALSSLADDVLSATLADVTEDGAQVRLELRAGSSLTATRRIADLGFTALATGDSGVFVISPASISGVASGGVPITDTDSVAGFLTLVGTKPALRISSGPRVAIFGIPTRRYRVETSPGISGPWTLRTTVEIPAGTTVTTLDVPADSAAAFIRAVEAP
jgi:subtilase family serine protease